MAWSSARAVVVAFALILGVGAAPVGAQEYPSRPIRIVAPFPAGGAADILASAIGQRFTEAWGQPGLMFDALPPSLPHIQAGNLTALGVAPPQRAASLPTVPAIAESGLPGFEVVSWFGIMAPAGTPERIVAKLRAEIGRALDAA